MSVQAVNSVNNIQQKPVQSPIEPKKSEQKESIVNGTTLLLGSLAALAIGTGIYFATKGRGGKSVANGTSSVTDEQKPLEILKEYTLDAFKNAGHKIEKGKAITSDGKNYTGKLTVNGKEEGSHFVIDYENGIMKKSVKQIGDNVVANRTYKYHDNGVISSVRLVKDNKITIFHHKSNGKLFQKSKPGGLYLYHPDGKTIKFSYLDSTMGGEIFDKNGNKIATLDTHPITQNKIIKYLNPDSDIKEVFGSMNTMGDKSIIIKFKDKTRTIDIYRNYDDKNITRYQVTGNDGFGMVLDMSPSSNRGFCSLKDKSKVDARFDLDKDEISIMPDSHATEEQIRKKLKEVKELIKLSKTQYRTIVDLSQAQRLRSEYHM